MNGVSKITVTEDVALITFPNMPADHKSMAAVLERFAQSEINIDMISQTTSQGGSISFSFTVSGEQLVPVLELLGDLRSDFPQIKPLVSSGNCKIQLYGEEMREMHGVAARAIRIVAETDAQVVIITTSEVDISLLCTHTHLDDCVRSLEKSFDLRSGNGK